MIVDPGTSHVKPTAGGVFTPQVVGAVEELTREAWQIPYAIRVDSVTNFQHSWADGDGLVVEDLVKNAMSLPDNYLEQKKQIALSEPLLINRLISPSAHVTGINVTINLPGKTITEVPEVAAFVRNLAADFRADHPEFKVYLTGVAMINNQFVESGQEDMKTLVPIMYLLVFIIMPCFLLHFLAGAKQPVSEIWPVAYFTLVQFLVLIPIGWLASKGGG